MQNSRRGMFDGRTVLACTSALAAVLVVPAAAYAQATNDQTTTSADVPANMQAPSTSAAVQSDASTTSAAPDTPAEDIIVTGTRDPRATVSSSVSPISVLGANQLAATGQPTLRDALINLSPSITRTAQSPTNANTVEKINLRGLSSNHTLILLNGLRRNPSPVLADAPGPEQGTAPVDIGLFPSSAIGRVEVLLDGASAQYGSDAIAGVVNLILKNNDHGVTITSNNGQFYEGDGFSSNTTFNAGMKLGNTGFLSVSADYLHSNHTNRGNADNRTGTRVNRFFGNPSQDKVTVSYNAGLDLAENIQAYSFATFAHRRASTFQNYRLPNRLPQVFPNGFTPTTTGREDNFGVTGGLKGEAGGWNWDISTTYGKDNIDNVTAETANISLYNDTGQTPTSFFTQGYANSQLTVEAVARRPVDLGLAEPINVAFGGQYRRDTYTVTPGEPDSYYGSGSQGQGGLNRFSAVDESRNVKALYVDISARPAEGLQLGAAGRYEHYSDAGGAFTGKASARYDFSPAFAVRGTVSNGFRGPNMPEQYFTSIAVTSTGGGGTLAVNSAAARALGAQNLKPEKSTNFSAGFVVRPAERMSLTIDAYQIKIRDRVLTGGVFNGQTAIDALRLIGVSFLPDIIPSAVSASFSTNGADTRTRGLDAVFNYRTDLGGAVIDWDASANFNDSKVTRVATDQNGRSLLSAQGVAFLETAFPKNKFIFGGNLVAGKFDVNLHEIRWGKTTTLRQFAVGPNAFSNTVFYVQNNEAKWQTNIEIGFQATEWGKLSIGATNLFDVRPTEVPQNTSNFGIHRYDFNSQQLGINGGYYYATLRLTF